MALEHDAPQNEGSEISIPNDLLFHSKLEFLHRMRSYSINAPDEKNLERFDLLILEFSKARA